MTYKKILLAGAGLLLLTGFYILGTRGEDTTIDTPVFILEGKTLHVEVADTAITRTQGLSGRDTLEKGTGVLFVFDTPGQYGFWMKDMNFPIDILWFDENKELVEVTRDVQPDTYPEVFYPKAPILYALEVNVGEFPERSLTLGTYFELSTYKEGE